MVIKINVDEKHFDLVLCKLNNAQKALFTLKILILTGPMASLWSVLSSDITITLERAVLISFALLIYIIIYVFLIIYFENRTQEYDAMAKIMLSRIQDQEREKAV